MMVKKVKKQVKSKLANECPEDKKPPVKGSKLAEKLSKIIFSWMKKRKHPLHEDQLTLEVEQYHIQGLICQGSFGKVLIATNQNTKLTAAAKIEPKDAQCPQLNNEYKIYEILGCTKPGFIKIYHFGPCDAYNVLIMELLGPDLDDLFVACQGQFSHKTVLMIAYQTLRIIEYIHNKNIIYRDIKPENFCIGNRYQKKNDIIHIIDFGLSKMIDQFARAKEEEYHGYLIGTARYMSVNSHFALDQSKRDDLESLAYMYIYFLKGRLPWMGLSKVQHGMEHYNNIAKIKMDLTPEELIGDYPEFVEFLKYIKTLRYMEEPDYGYILAIIHNALQENNYANDMDFDWSPIMKKKYLTKAIEIDPDD